MDMLFASRQKKRIGELFEIAFSAHGWEFLHGFGPPKVTCRTCRMAKKAEELDDMRESDEMLDSEYFASRKKQKTLNRKEASDG